MSSDILPCWLRQFRHCAHLRNVVKAEVLRRWSLSEVLRLTADDGSTIVAKLGRGAMSNERDIYNDILVPANISVPTMYENFHTDIGGVILMEDLGNRTIEKEPQPRHFVESARQLARIRLLVSDYLTSGSIAHDNFQRHLAPKEQFLEDISYLTTQPDPSLVDYREVLQRVPSILGKNLELLYRDCPITITHNDYHSKNLIIKGEQIVPIDWSSAYLSPHLGDLYCIMQEASDHGVDETELIDAYFSVTDSSYAVDKATCQWQIDIGALCWEIHVLRWIVEFGVNAIEEAREWVPGIALSIGNIADRSTLHTWKNTC